MTYDVILLVFGIGILGVALLPRVLSERPLSYPVLYVAAGVILFRLPLGLEIQDPVVDARVAERLTEMGVIVALMGAGLRIDRRVGWGSWRSTWGLLAVTMPLSIAAAGLIGYWILGLAPPAAMLLGAVMAPTDPVLASDVQVEGPHSGDEHEVRFALTSEAGLNDGLAFPFTYAAIAMAVYGVNPSGWIGDWFLIDVLYRLGTGALAGIVLGRCLAFVVFRWARKTPLRETEGLIALAGTFMVYGATELLHGYGFLAVFVAAYVLRDYERDHEFHNVLHVFADQIERLLSAIILLLFGGALASGALTPFDWRTITFAAALLLVIRPVAGVLGVLGSETRRRDRLAIAFFGIRGIGSLYYLFYAFNADVGFGSDADLLWAAVSLTILVSIVVHGIAASPVIRRLEN